MNFDKELDARGLNCPLPILRTKKALSDLQSGQVLKVLATDPDYPDFSTVSTAVVSARRLWGPDSLEPDFNAEVTIEPAAQRPGGA